MFLRTDNVCHMHKAVINYHSIIIGRDTIRLDNNKIPDAVGIKFHIPPDQIMDNDLFIGRYPQADRRFATLRFKFSNLFRSQVSAFAHIPGHLSLT